MSWRKFDEEFSKVSLLCCKTVVKQLSMENLSMNFYHGDKY